jgi:hypothetical protein
LSARSARETFFGSFFQKRTAFFGFEKRPSGSVFLLSAGVVALDQHGAKGAS